MSPSAASSDFHNALPLPDPGPVSGSTDSAATTRAPSHDATAAVESVEPSSSTTTSSIRSTSSMSVRRTVATMWPTVASSLRAGRHTERLSPRAALARASSAAGKSSWRHRAGSRDTRPEVSHPNSA